MEAAGILIPAFDEREFRRLFGRSFKKAVDTYLYDQPLRSLWKPSTWLQKPSLKKELPSSLDIAQAIWVNLPHDARRKFQARYELYHLRRLVSSYLSQMRPDLLHA